MFKFRQQWKVIPDIWESLAATIPEHTMIVDNIHGGPVELSFSEVNDLITQAAAALQKLGVFPGDCIAIFAENSYRWFLLEQAIMKVLKTYQHYFFILLILILLISHLLL